MALGTYTSTLVIEELTAGAGSSPRSVTLNGPSLPLMGAEWAMKVAAVTTWYPGNPDEATQQVLGPQELPSRWNGDWRRTMIGTNPVGYIDDGGNVLQLVDPADIRDALESIARAGQRLRVTWNQLGAAGSATPGQAQEQQVALKSMSGKIVREGRMTELKFKYTRLQDIEWEIQFDWMSRGGTVARTTATRANTVVSDSAAYLNAIQALVNANQDAQALGQLPTNLTLGQLEAFANAPTALVNSLARKMQQVVSNVSQVVSIAQTIASQPVQIANRAVDLARDSVSQVNAMYDTLSAIPYEGMSTKAKVADLVRAWTSFGEQSDLAQGAAHAGQQFTTKLETSVQGYVAGQKNTSKLASPASLQQIYVVKDGDTPATISQAFFDTPDRAVDILKTNGLSWYTPTLPPGKIILIPVIQTTDPTQGV